jgi:negative regulator of flagellin synthesis FlgM
MKVKDCQQTIEAALQSKQANAKKEKATQRAASSEEGSTSAESAQVNLSQESKVAQKASETIRNTPDVRQEKIQALKEKIEAGEYQIDSDKVADKLLRNILSELIR